MSQTRIIKCDCKCRPYSSDPSSKNYQEKFYGVGNRLGIKSERNNVFCCSICGRSSVLNVK